MDEKTKVENIINWLKNHRFISYIIVFAIMTIGIANFKDAIFSLFLNSDEPQNIEIGNQNSTINFNLYDSSQIKNVVGHDQINYYLQDSSPLLKARKDGSHFKK